jgi:hypothetical protein
MKLTGHVRARLVGNCQHVELACPDRREDDSVSHFGHNLLDQFGDGGGIRLEIFNRGELN